MKAFATEHSYILFLGLFIGFLAAISQLGFDVGDQSNPAADNPLKTEACSNIGGWDAVGDVASCVTGTLGSFYGLTQLDTRLGTLNIVLGALSLPVVWLILKRIRGG